MVMDLDEDTAIDFQWMPLKLVRFHENYWILVPDGTKLAENKEYKPIEVGVDVAQFGMPTDTEFYQCIVFEYGVLVLSVVTMPDQIVRNAVVGNVQAMFMSETGTQSYNLYFRTRYF